MFNLSRHPSPKFTTTTNTNTTTTLLLLLRRRRVASTAFRLVFFFSPAPSVLPPSRSLPPPSLSLVVEKQRGASLPEKRVTVATGGSARRVSSPTVFSSFGLNRPPPPLAAALSPFFLRLLLVSPSVRPRLTERHTSVSTRARNPRRGPFDVVSPPPTAEFARRSVAETRVIHARRDESSATKPPPSPLEGRKNERPRRS